MNLEATPPSAKPMTVTPPPILRKIFIGKDGLRAGWSLLLFIVIFAAAIFAAHAITLKFHHPAAHTSTSEDSAKSTIINEAVVFVVVFIVTWIMSKIERRPNSVYGFGGGHKMARFVAGLGWGVVCLSLLVGILWKTGFLVFDGRLIFGADIFRYGAIWLFGFLLVGLLEEYLTRGYLQFTLKRGLAGLYRWAFKSNLDKTGYSDAFGFWISAVIFSILFGLGHSKNPGSRRSDCWISAVIFSILFGLGHSKNPGESPIGLLAAGLAGMVFCLSLWRTGSLWWAIGFHTSWDWAQSFLYGVADSGHMVQHHLLATHPVGKPILSGGATGPEGSIFVIAVLALVALIILFTLPRTRRSDAVVG